MAKNMRLWFLRLLTTKYMYIYIIAYFITSRKNRSQTFQFLSIIRDYFFHKISRFEREKIWRGYFIKYLQNSNSKGITIHKLIE